MVRREFLKKALTVPAVIAAERTVSGLLYTDNDTLSTPPKAPLSPHTHSSQLKIKPKALKDGSKVAFTAPASAASVAMIRRGVATFETFGCEVVIGDTIKEQDRSYRYFSAGEEERASEFMSFINDSSVDAIICGRGGYGVMRILDHLDWEAIKQNPKIIMGFSDITALVNPVYSLANIISFHGPVGYSSFNKYTTDHVRKLLFNENWDTLEVDFSQGSSIGTAEIAEGELVGGNLKLVVSILGTPFEPDFNNKILFLEDVSEQPYKIDRMLTQLRLAGVFNKVKAVLVGNIGPLDKRYGFEPYGSYTIREVFEQLLVPTGLPVLVDLPFGHTRNNLAMPIGAQVSIDPDKKVMTLLERPVS